MSDLPVQAPFTPPPDRPDRDAREDRIAEARRLALMLKALRDLPKPLVARVMTEFGDRAAASITTRELDDFLAELDKTLSARSVNLYRQALCNLYVYGGKRGTYSED